MTRRTQRHKVTLVMRPTFGERHNMVDFLGGCQRVGLGALLTQRMRRDILVTDTLPRSAVAFACSGIALVFLITLRLLFVMCRAEAAVRQRRTARVTAWTLWFSWHMVHLSGKEKSSRRPAPKALLSCDIIKRYQYNRSNPKSHPRFYSFALIFRRGRERDAPTHGFSCYKQMNGQC